jgi:hypothetical protein
MNEIEQKIADKEAEIVEYKACMKRLANHRWAHYMVERLEEKVAELNALKSMC